MTYSVIYADPPWSYSDKALAGDRGAEFQYPTMSVSEISSLPVRRLAADDCALFMWVTMPQLPVGIRVMSAWGFAYKTCAFVWVKTAMNGGVKWGMGNWTRANAEVCLLGVRGKPKRVSAGVHSVVQAVPGRHSEKPAEVRERIVQLMGDVPRVELFARGRVDGWDSWGNEVESDVSLDPVKLSGIRSKLRTQVRGTL